MISDITIESTGRRILVSDRLISTGVADSPTKRVERIYRIYRKAAREAKVAKIKEGRKVFLAIDFRPHHSLDPGANLVICLMSRGLNMILALIDSYIFLIYNI